MSSFDSANALEAALTECDETTRLKALRKVSKVTIRNHIEITDLSAVLVSKLFDTLIAVLNVTDNDEHALSCKEVALETLDSLAGFSEANASAVQNALLGLHTSFETYLLAHTDIDEAITAKMNCHVLSLLLRFTDYRLKGSDLFELVAGSMKIAVSTLFSLLKSPTSSVEAKVGAASTLVDLTYPDTYFAKEQLSDPNDTALATLTSQFQQHINCLMAICIDNDLIGTLATTLIPWVKHASISRARFGGHSMFQEPTEKITVHALEFITNLMYHATHNAAKFRRNVANQSGIVEHVVLPYMSSIISDAGCRNGIDIDTVAMQDAMTHYKLRLVLSLLVSVTYRIRSLRVKLSQSNASWRLLLRKFDIWPADISSLALFMKLAINLDIFAGDDNSNSIRRNSKDARVTRTKSRSGTVSDDDEPDHDNEAMKLMRKHIHLVAAQGAKLVDDIVIDDTQTSATRDSLQDESQTKPLSDLNRIKAIVLQLSDNDRMLLRKFLLRADPVAPALLSPDRITYQKLLFAFSQLHYEIERNSFITNDSEWNDADVVFHSPDNHRSPRSGQLAQLSSQSPQPISQDIADVKHTGESSLSENVGEAKVSECLSASQDALQELRLAETETNSAAAQSARSYTSLPSASVSSHHPVELPSIQARRPHHVRPLTGLKSYADRPSQQAPQEFLCSLTKQLMEDPVRLRSDFAKGFAFERSSLTAYVNEHGSLPAKLLGNSGRSGTVSLDDIEPDTKLAKRISQWNFEQLVRKRPF